MDSSIIAEVSAPKRTPRGANIRTTRPTVHAVGINDFPLPTRVNGKEIRSYYIWHAMLARCYSAVRQAKQPTYAECTVAENWHYFSNFEKWFTENYIDGYQMDKDLLVQGNKVYSEDTCIFVSSQLNSLLADRAKSRGSLPLGVSTKGARFEGRVHRYGYQVYLGSFSTPLEAHQAWQRAKADHIESFPTTDPRIRAALDLRVAQLRDDLANNRITEKL